MKRTVIAILLALALVVSIGSVLAFAENKTLNKDSILYDGPGSNYTALGYMKKGETFVKLHDPYYNYTHGYAGPGTQIYAFYGESMQGYIYMYDLS